MTLKDNTHVSRLHRYLPFSPLHSQIYEEQADPDHTKSIRTKASGFLAEVVREPATRLVVLTGDAGHGKTHLCRRLLEQILDLEPRQAHECLRELGNGEVSVGKVGVRELYVIRDLSEIADEEAAVDLMARSLDDPLAVLVVCANEGKLRKVLSSAPEALALIRETLEEGRARGRTAIQARVTVLDLNNQSVTAGDGESFLDELLQQWVRDGRSWRVCSDCDAAAMCPIKTNRDALAGENNEARGETRREGLRTLLQVVEQSGVSVTIRELLILMSFAITGGMDCSGVHRRWKSESEDRSWQAAHLYSQVIFEPPLSRDDRNALSILSVLGRVDPGKQAIRAVDDVLAADPLIVDDEFAPGQFVGTMETPKSRREAKKEAERHRALFEFLRRRDFFELHTENGGRDRVARSERLGFRYHDEFQFLLGDAGPGERTVVRNKILRGLEAVQDVRRGKSERSKFAVVDPAFANVRGNASVIASMIPVTKIRVASVSSFWDGDSDVGVGVADAVDWVDRQVIVRFEQAEVDLALDLLQFEFVLRSAEGLSCRNFFKPDIRRISATLARLADVGSAEENEINVAFADRHLQLFIDEGNRIGCQGSIG